MILIVFFHDQSFLIFRIIQINYRLTDVLNSIKAPVFSLTQIGSHRTRIGLVVLPMFITAGRTIHLFLFD